MSMFDILSYCSYGLLFYSHYFSTNSKQNGIQYRQDSEDTLYTRVMSYGLKTKTKQENNQHGELDSALEENAKITIYYDLQPERNFRNFILVQN